MATEEKEEEEEEEDEEEEEEEKEAKSLLLGYVWKLSTHSVTPPK